MNIILAMNITQRHQEILAVIKHEKYITVSEISKLLGVSEVTIRKDFNYLEEKNLIYRHHGGASLNNPYVVDLPVSQKQNIKIEEKNRIAEKAVEFIEDNDVVILGSGTTIYNMVNYISKEKNITVITSSLLIAARLCEFHNVTIIQLGGRVRYSSQSTVGPNAQEMMLQFSANKLFLGVDLVFIVVKLGVDNGNFGDSYLWFFNVNVYSTVFYIICKI
jgi:DeoR family transcriptional regulator of aga operon